MQILDSKAVANALPYAELVDVLAGAFRSDATAPARTSCSLPVPGEVNGTLLLMPAWRSGDRLGVKIASVFPGNATRGVDTVQASYLLMDGMTGEPLALLDGGELTLRRTAAASALASRYLSRRASHTLLIVGTGNLAPHLVAAHAAVRPIERVLVWGRRPTMAGQLAARVRRDGLDAEVADSLDASVREASIISCATMSSEPLVLGRWLRPGQHVDLVGAYTPDMREADHEALSRSRVFVDTFEGALSEAGEIVQAIEAGVIRREDICGDLRGLAGNVCTGRTSDDDITLFKSVGAAIEDLAAASHAVRRSDRTIAE